MIEYTGCQITECKTNGKKVRNGLKINVDNTEEWIKLVSKLAGFTYPIRIKQTSA